MSADHAKKDREAVLVEGAVGRTLIRLTLPMIVGMMSMVGFNVVDTFFVSRLGTHELAAISFTFPVILVISSISIGLGIGAASAVAKAIGRGDGHGVRRLTTDAISLSFLIVVAVAVLGLLTIDPLFTALGAGPDVLPLVREYMTIWYVGVPFVVIPMVGNSAIRATGDAKTPAIIMVIAMTVNLVLDPLLIFGLGPFPAMGLGGAALATLAARASAMAASVWIMVHREHMLTLERPAPSDGLASWREILHVGAPAGLTQLVVPVSMGVVTRLVSGYGVEAVAGFGVATRLEMVPVMLITAMGSVMVPFAGQNWGAGRADRVKSGMRFGYLYASAVGAVAFVVALLAARPIAGLFDDDPLVISTVVTYLLIVSASYGPQGMLHLATAGFNALSKPVPAMVLSLLRMFVLYLPLAYAGSVLFGIPGIFWAAFVTNIVGGGGAVVWFRSTLSKMVAARSEAPVA